MNIVQIEQNEKVGAWILLFDYMQKKDNSFIFKNNLYLSSKDIDWWDGLVQHDWINFDISKKYDRIKSSLYEAKVKLEFETVAKLFSSLNAFEVLTGYYFWLASDDTNRNGLALFRGSSFVCFVKSFKWIPLKFAYELELLNDELVVLTYDIHHEEIQRWKNLRDGSFVSSSRGDLIHKHPAKPSARQGYRVNQG